MDGYIRDINHKITTCKRTIISKCSVSLFVFFWALICIFMLCVMQPPKDWKETDIVFSGFYREHTGLSRVKADTIHGADGTRFSVDLIDKAALEKLLTIGEKYHLVYRETFINGNSLVCISDGNELIGSFEDAVKHYEADRSDLVTVIWVTVGIGFISILMIDRTWCKREHEEIKLLKWKIKKRRDRMSKHKDPDVK